MSTKVSYAVKVKNNYISTIYNDSTSEVATFDRALQCATYEEAIAVRDLAMRRKSDNAGDYKIIKRETVYEEVE